MDLSPHCNPAASFAKNGLSERLNAPLKPSAAFKLRP
jgi:hypothetical protein